MTTWFTSDTHFGHTNIIKYCNRPFKDVTEMDEALIANWNSVVKQNDDIYHLGDFGFATVERIQRIVNRLNGKKHLIFGNHDKHMAQIKGFESKQYYLEITVDKQKIILCHYAMRVWNKSHHGSIMLFGHSHGNLPGTNQSLDVGTDPWNYFPTNLDLIRQRLKTLPAYKSEDHHGRTMDL